MMNNNGLQDRGLLDVIRILSSQGASGRLHISTGMTEGALFFARGQLVDARLGKLTGFQAINALVSVPDASYNFDPEITPPVQSSIAPNERLLLKDFFGIAVADSEHSNDEDDEATLVSPRPVVVEPRRESTVAESRAEGPARYRRRPALQHHPIKKPRSLPKTLLLILVVVLVAAAAAALAYRFRKSDATASVAPSVQTSPSGTVAQQPTTQTPQQPDTQTTQQPQTTVAVPNLSGNWQVINTVEQTAYEPYRNMKIGFTVAINQAGRDFTGTGQKISENGRSLPAAGRTAISVKGTIDGDQIHATFSENGAARKTNGHFVWTIDKGSGGLIGTFVSTAAGARGKSAARKVL
jgi:hypothetical protein